MVEDSTSVSYILLHLFSNDSEHRPATFFYEGTHYVPKWKWCKNLAAYSIASCK